MLVLVLSLLSFLTPLSLGHEGLATHYAHAGLWDYTLPGLFQNVAGMVAEESTTALWKEAGNWLGQFLLSIGSFSVWIGGSIFDYSMQWFVVEFGSRVRDPLFDGALTTSWSTVRDICNLAFIFGFIYIGIRTIIDPDSSSMKRFLSRIIIGALLINFSLYITQVIIDFTNFIAVKIYDAIVPPNEVITISRALGNYLGINGLFSDVSPEVLAQLSAGGTIAFYFAATAFMCVAGFTFAAGGFMLLTRFVTLLLVMIFSPVFFAARVFPQTEQYATRVWNTLLSSAMYAPAYMLLLYLSLAIANALVKPTDIKMNAVLSGQSSGDGAFTVVLNFIIIIFLMVSALTLAKKMSVYGGQMAINLSDGARKGAQGVLGRNLVARPAGSLLNWYQKSDASISEMKGFRGGLNKAARWTFDNTGTTRALQNKLEKTKKSNFGSSYTLEDNKKWQKETDNKRIGIRENAETLKKITENTKRLKEGETRGDADAITNAQTELQKAVLGASQAQLLELLGEFKKDSKEYTGIISNMSHAQFEKLMDEKEENFNDEEKDAVKKARQKIISDKLLAAENKKRAEAAAKKGEAYTPSDTIPRALANASISELEVLGFDALKSKENAGMLTAAQLEDIKKSKKFVETQYAQIEQARKAYFAEILAITDVGERGKRIEEEFQNRKAKDLVKLPKELLQDIAARGYITVDVLQSMIDEKLDRSVQQTIVKNLAGYEKLSADMRGYLDTGYMQGRFQGELQGMPKGNTNNPAGPSIIMPPSSNSRGAA